LQNDEKTFAMPHQIIRIVFCALVFTSASALAEERYALIIGNGAYENIDPLGNPSNDVKLVAEALQAVGFETTLLIDANKRQMDDAARNFARKLDDAGRNTVGVFYYAGHGVSYEGENWLVPVAADIREGVDIEYGTVSANKVLRLMESARNATDIMILDACRNSPFRGFSLSGTRAISAGMSQMDAPAGSYIAYSTAPGAVAYDGTGDFSPFAEAFAAEVRTPGLSIGDMMIEVRNRVKASTEGLGATPQTPWDASSLTGRFLFNPGQAVVPPQAAVYGNVALARLPENEHAAGRGYYLGDTFVLESKEENWLAWRLVREKIGGDFRGRATVSLTNARIPRSTAGLLFDSSDSSEPDLAIGAIFFGKFERELLISRKAASGSWEFIDRQPVEVSGEGADTFEIERIGKRYRFLFNDREVGTWSESTTQRGALKFYVNDGHAVMRDWSVETIGSSQSN
jgi:hypothetical protein